MTRDYCNAMKATDDCFEFSSAFEPEEPEFSDAEIDALFENYISEEYDKTGGV